MNDIRNEGVADRSAGRVRRVLIAAGLTAAVVGIVLASVWAAGYDGKVRVGLRVVRLLLLGGFAFAWRVATQVSPDVSVVTSAAVYLAIFSVGLHLFLRWLARSVMATGAATEAAPPQKAPPAAWPVRRTVAVVGVVFLMFAAGVAAVGVAHQAAWLLRPDGDLFAKPATPAPAVSVAAAAATTATAAAVAAPAPEPPKPPPFTARWGGPWRDVWMEDALKSMPERVAEYGDRYQLIIVPSNRYDFSNRYLPTGYLGAELWIPRVPESRAGDATVYVVRQDLLKTITVDDVRGFVERDLRRREWERVPIEERRRRGWEP